MGEIGGELAFVGEHCGDPRPEAVEHPPDRGHLSRTAGNDSRVEVAAADPLGHLGEVADRPRQPRGDPIGDHNGSQEEQGSD